MASFRPEKGCFGSRASSQVDWAISLGIFLLYIAWFFILARPVYESGNSLGTVADFVVDEIIENSSWVVLRIPLFFNATYEDAFEPIISQFPFDWENETYTLSSERYFATDPLLNRLYSVYAVRPGNFSLWLVHSESSYSVPFFSKDLEADREHARISGRDFEVVFSNSSISEVRFRDVLRVRNYSLFVNGAEFRGNVSSFFGRPVVARYFSSSGDVNQTFMLFPERSRIFFEVSTSSLGASTITLSFEMDDYPSYYANPDSMGNFNYSLNRCINASGTYLKLYSSISGVVFRTDSPADYTLCARNSSVLSVNASMTGESMEGVLIFHDSSENFSSYWRPVNYAVGTAVKREGVSLSAIESLKDYDYAVLKDSWNVPPDVDFSFSLFNSTGSEVVSFEPEKPLETDNVFAVRRNVGVVDMFGSWKSYTLVVRAW